MQLRRFVVTIACGITLAAMSWITPSQGRAAADPALSQPRMLALVAGDLHIDGANLGSGSTPRSIEFHYGATVTYVSSGDPSVSAWTESGIDLKLPPVVHSGTVVVIVDGRASAPSVLTVFERTNVSTGSSGGIPLATAVAPDGRVWINAEFHTELKDVTGGEQPSLERRAIPQASGPGIFAIALNGDSSSHISHAGEDVDVDSAGDVWFTEGGAYTYNGVNFNTSRVVRYRPSTQTFTCYIVPEDSAEVTGVMIDETRGRVWYAESSLSKGNAVASFDPDTAPADCNWDPRTGARPVDCGSAPVVGCHTRFIFPHEYAAPTHLALDRDGNVWVTEYWSNGVARLDPAAGSFTEIPLPPSRISVGPAVYLGSGPWDIEIDRHGMVWITEFFDATVTRIDPSVMASSDCTHLDLSAHNPCVTEVFVGSDGYDGSTIHSLAIADDGSVWFSRQLSTGAQIGVVDPDDLSVALTPAIPDLASSSGLSIDPANGAIWVADLVGSRVVRFREASGDGDAVPSATDNCPNAYNPGQENADGNFVDLPAARPFDDLTWPNSDDIGDACDPDADNDGLSNDVEATLPGLACPSATAPTDPLLRDSDGDGVLDGAECRLGSDPADPVSFPSRSPAGDSDRDQLTDAFELSIGTDPYRVDTDGDRVNDGVEIKYYNTDPLRANTDGDRCDDGKEVNSVNNDQWVNVIDILLVSVSIANATSPKYDSAFDINKDGAINPGDMATTAGGYGPC